MDYSPSSPNPFLSAAHAGQEFRIVEDDCVGCFLYISRDGELVASDLCSVIEDARKLAFEKYGVPLEAWQPL